MLISGTIERPLRIQRLKNVVEALTIRRKAKSAQIPAGEDIGEALPSFDFEQLKCPRSLSPFLHLIQEQPTVRRNLQRLYCRVVAGPSCRRIDQKMILAVCAFTHVNARLLLVGQPLPEEV